MLRRTLRMCLAATLASSGLALVSLDGATAHDSHDSRAHLSTRLSGLSEVPAVVTSGRGRLELWLSHDGLELEYKLKVKDMEGDVTQAHLHLGKSRTNGAVIAFLCQTQEKPDPTGLAPTCVSQGRVSGVLTAANVIGPSNQGIDPGDFESLLRALFSNAVYVNVHSTVFAGGEVRGQVD